MDVTALTQSQPSPAATGQSNAAFSELGSSEFFELILTDLLNQDPLEPTDNQKLLEQISSIRELEMNSEITTSLRSLTDQQRFGSASNLIGRYVESNVPLDAGGQGFRGGVVTGVRFDDSGEAVLQLDSGTEMPMGNLRWVSSLEQIAQALVGKIITAEVVVDGASTEVEGLVTEVKTIGGQVMLELDSGEQVALTQVRGQRSLS